MVLPPDFDRSTVQRLIDAVEQGRNATILKVGYFFRRGKPSLPVPEGFDLLKAALAKETIGSRRWFILEELRGWAGARNKDISPDEAMQAYDEIFSHATEAQKAGAAYALSQAIHEYVFSVVSNFQKLGLIADERTKDVLFKAWTAYATYLGQNKVIGHEPYWAEAIDKAGLTAEFVPKVEQALMDPRVPKTYGLLTTAAQVLHPTKPERALELMRQAKPLVPIKDMHEMHYFYKTWVDWLSEGPQGVQANPDAAKMKEAIGIQQDLVKLTGRGQARLLVLLALAQDQMGFDRELASLLAPDVDEHEINEAVDRMMQIGPAAAARKIIADSPAELLRQYLTGARQRDVEQELHARYVLGYILIHQQKREEAKVALSLEHIKLPLLTGEARRFYAQIQKLLVAANLTN